MAITRSSILLWLSVVLVVVAYLQTQPPIMDWTYQQWLAAIYVFAAWGIGKLQRQPQIVEKFDASTKA